MKRIDKIEKFTPILDIVVNNDYVKNKFLSYPNGKKNLKVLLLRIHKHKTFKDIGKEIGVCSYRAKQIFDKSVKRVLRYAQFTIFKSK